MQPPATFWNHGKLELICIAGCGLRKVCRGGTRFAKYAGVRNPLAKLCNIFCQSFFIVFRLKPVMSTWTFDDIPDQTDKVAVITGGPYQFSWPVGKHTTSLITSTAQPLKLPNLPILIFSANTGIGFHMARHLAKNGAHVVLACRTKSRADAAADSIRKEFNLNDKNVKVMILDVSDQDSVRVWH